MKNLRVHFAFGRHAGSSSSANRTFFKRATAPYIQGCLDKGLRVLVILENGVPGLVEEVCKKFGAETSRKIRERVEGKHKENVPGFQEFLADTDAGLNAAFAETLGMGLPCEGYPEFGFEEEFEGVNRKKPGSVMYVVEPQVDEFVLRYWQHEWLYDKVQEIIASGTYDEVTLIEDLIRAIKLLAMVSFARDKLVVNVGPTFLKEAEGDVLAVPRGIGHYRMVEQVAEDAEVSSEMERTIVTLGFVTTAASNLFYSRMDEETIHGFATLELRALERSIHGDIELPETTDGGIDAQLRRYHEASRLVGIEHRETVERLMVHIKK